MNEQVVHAAMPYDHDDDRWAAVLRRDPGAEGVFWYGVLTTGVYCRPTCPSRRPRRANVAFFDTAAAAEQAGLRPCRRCRPHEVSTQQRVVAQVQHLLETAEPAPALAELGRRVGVSPYHLQRLFKRATGLSPREYAAARRAERLKAGLREGASVTDAMYDAGYGSARALYAAARRDLGMSPSAYKSGGQGQTIAYACAETLIGPMLLAATAAGVCAVQFGNPADLVAGLRAEFPRAELVEDEPAVRPYIDAVVAHIAGQRRDLDLPTDVRATAFQARVWAALRSIPYGETRSYRDVARMIGEPTAVRAVARACATNPVAVIVPCHRVVGSDGSLTGYRWGVGRKQALLEREGALAGR